MAKAQRKALRRLERRTNAHNATLARQTSGNFRPNATGPMHKQHAPGSLKK